MDSKLITSLGGDFSVKRSVSSIRVRRRKPRAKRSSYAQDIAKTVNGRIWIFEPLSDRQGIHVSVRHRHKKIKKIRKKYLDICTPVGPTGLERVGPTRGQNSPINSSLRLIILCTSNPIFAAIFSTHTHTYHHIY